MFRKKPSCPLWCGAPYDKAPTAVLGCVIVLGKIFCSECGEEELVEKGETVKG